MKKTTYKDLSGRSVDVTLEVGDVISMTKDKGIQVEIGPNDTMRGLRNGTPDPKGWQSIPDAAVARLCKCKLYL